MLSSHILNSALFHSIASYSTSSVELTGRLNSNGWIAVGAAELDMDPSYFGIGIGDTDYLYDVGYLKGHVSRTTDTLVIAFSGTDSVFDALADISAGILNWTLLYESFRPLVDAFWDYASENSFSQIIVTGHSMGGAIAELFMAEYSHVANLYGVTIGSPGVRTSAIIPTNRFINFANSDDVVVDATFFDDSIGSNVEINSQLSSGVLGEHSSMSYLEHINIITESRAASEFYLNPNHYSIYIADGQDNSIPTQTYNFILTLGGNDTIASTSNGDLIDSGSGVDTILAGGGDDWVYAGNQADFLYGQSDNDHLFGEEGNDLLSGGDGQDELHGGRGNDTLVGGHGQNTLIGGAGEDRFVLSQDGYDTITDYLKYDDQYGDLIDVSFYVGQAFQDGELAHNLVRLVDGTNENDFIIEIDIDGTGTVYDWESIGILTDLDFQNIAFNLTGESSNIDLMLQTELQSSDWSLSASSAVVTEDSGQVTFTITRADSALAATVYFSTLDLWEINSSDFTPILHQEVNFEVGELTATITVDILDDTEWEFDQVFAAAVQHSNTSIPNVRDYGLAFTRFTIEDDDPFPEDRVNLEGYDTVSNMGALLDDTSGTSGTDHLTLDYSGLAGVEYIDLNLHQDGTTSSNREAIAINGSTTYVSINGFEAFTITGTDGNDSFTTNANSNGVDVIYGGAGIDSFTSYGGADRLYGEAGDDRFFGITLEDFVSGGAGDDIVYFNLQTETAGTTLDMTTGNDGQWAGVERYQGTMTEFDDTVIAGAQLNTLTGGGGTDHLTLDYSGLAGVEYIDLNLHQDATSSSNSEAIAINGSTTYVSINGFEAFTITGTDGNDSFNTNANSNGVDVIYGGTGNDNIYTYGGDDTLIGGLGNDLLAGGQGADTFIFHEEFGEDRILDFDTSEDTLWLPIDPYTRLAVVMSMMTQNSDGVTLDLGDGNSILFDGMQITDFEPTNFRFGHDHADGSGPFLRPTDVKPDNSSSKSQVTANNESITDQISQVWFEDFQDILEIQDADFQITFPLSEYFENDHVSPEGWDGMFFPDM